MNLSTNLILSLFDKGLLPWPSANHSVFAINVQNDEKFKKIDNLDIYQNFKPYTEILEINGLNSSPILPEAHYDYVLCDLPKQKIATKYYLAYALSVLSDDGFLIAAAPNDAGGKRSEKWFQEFGLDCQSLSKSKCRVVWAQKKNVVLEKIKQCLSEGAIQKIQFEDMEFHTKPGIFGWNKIDKGSQKLIETLPEIKGVGADYGCGYGFLSNAILEGNAKIKKLYCFDADNEALECCKKNLKKHENKITHNWLDLTKKQKIEPLDWIVMNPPFHEGKNMDTSVGKNFIESAHGALKKSGKLYMVANAHLPYEKLLESIFSSVVKIKEEDGFKIFHAQK